MWGWYRAWGQRRATIRREDAENFLASMCVMLRKVRGECALLHEDVDLALQDLDRILAHATKARSLLGHTPPVEDKAVPLEPSLFSSTQRQRAENLLQ